MTEPAVDVESAEEQESKKRTFQEVLQQTEIEPFLKVGTHVTIQPEESVHKESHRFSSTMRGWYKERYLLMDFPPSPRFSRESRVNATFIIRFIHEGAVCAFVVRLHDEYRGASLPFLRFDWPENIETMPMRNHERMEIDVDCEVKLGSGDILQGIIQNVSAGGCNIICSKAPLLKDLVLLTFTMPGGSEFINCPAIVRNHAPADGEYSIGCQFRDPAYELESVIELMVASQSPDRRSDKPGKPQVLIIEMGPGDCKSLRDALFSDGCNSYLARSAIEGLSCLTDLQPGAILIGHAEGKSGEKEVCSLLKDTRGMENTPVFVYNIREQELTDRGTESSVVAYFNPDTPHTEISQFVCAAVSDDNA